MPFKPILSRCDFGDEPAPIRERLASGQLARTQTNSKAAKEIDSTGIIAGLAMAQEET